MAKEGKLQNSKAKSKMASPIAAQKEESAAQCNVGINDPVTMAGLSSSPSSQQPGYASVRKPIAAVASVSPERSIPGEPAGMPPKPDVQLPGQQQPSPTTEMPSMPSNSPPALKSTRHQRAFEILSRPQCTPLATLDGPFDLRRLLLRELNIARAQERARRESTPSPETPVDREGGLSDATEEAEKEKRTP